MSMLAEITNTDTGSMNSNLVLLKLNKYSEAKRKIGIPENCIIGIGEKLFIPEFKLKIV